MTPTVSTAVQPRTGGEEKARHLGRGHLVPLDGLRGIAILAVMLSHLFAVNYGAQGPITRLIGNILYWGIWGVDVFFVLSGFLITGILVDSVAGPHYFRNFYMRRVLRIFPLYYGALLLLFLLTPALGIQWHGLKIPLLLYLQNGARYQPWTELMGGRVSLNHLWSLAIEEQFYLLWPLLVFAARTPRRVMTAALAGCVLALCFRLTLWGVWHNGFTTHFNMFARADALLFGGVLALLFRGGHWPAVLRWSRPVFFTMTGLLAVSIVAGNRLPFSSPYWICAFRYSCVALAAGGLLAWSLRAGTFSRVCGLQGLRFFGKYSYGLYVLHMTFLPLLSESLRPGLFRLTGSRTVAVAGSAVLIVALASLAAYLCYHLFEKRFLKLKRFFDYSAPARP